jgi:hypothetical protein
LDITGIDRGRRPVPDLSFPSRALVDGTPREGPGDAGQGCDDHHTRPVSFVNVHKPMIPVSVKNTLTAPYEME